MLFKQKQSFAITLFFFQVEFGSILRDEFSKLLVLIPQQIIQRDTELTMATQSRMDGKRETNRLTLCTRNAKEVDMGPIERMETDVSNKVWLSF